MKVVLVVIVIVAVIIGCSVRNVCTKLEGN